MSNLMPIMPPLSQINPAQWTYEKLVKSIVNFESKLSQEEEIGGRIVGAPGPDGSFHIEDIGFQGPFIVIFRGTSSDGRPIELHQHYTQLSVLLTALPKLTDTPRRIGFHLSEEAKVK